MKKSMLEAVKRGSQLLDTVTPGWYKGINIESLKLDNCYFCILGQLYRHWSTGLTKLFGKVDLGFSEKHGFSVEEMFSYRSNEEKEEEYTKLTQLWILEIFDRNKKDKKEEEADEQTEVQEEEKELVPA